LSRFDETPEELLIELRGDDYVALGDGKTVALEEARQRLLTDLPTSASDALSMAEIRLRSRGLAATTIERARDKLVAEGTVVRFGKGVKGSPHRFWLRGPAGNDSDRPAAPDADAADVQPGESSYPSSIWGPDVAKAQPEDAAAVSTAEDSPGGATP
jgi:hypothetical protein